MSGVECSSDHQYSDPNPGLSGKQAVALRLSERWRHTTFNSLRITGKRVCSSVTDGCLGNRLYRPLTACVGGAMRSLLRKRKVVCLALVSLFTLISLMLGNMLFLDFRGMVKIEDLRLYRSANTRAVPVPISYISFIVKSNATPSREGGASVDLGTQHCEPVRNVAFVKTHKAGSTTMANILLRFGISHGLNFALPNTKLHAYGYNYISRAGEVLTKDYIFPLPFGEQYNILFNHAIYNRTAFRTIMPEGTRYITILREPFQQFVSTFEYYHVDKYFVKKGVFLPNATNPISAFLANPTAYDHSNTMYSYIRNKQSEDLGFDKGHAQNRTMLMEYIDQMEKDFSVVMILEYFDESLLMIKREFCWDFKDILYIPHNANNKKPLRNFTESDHVNHRSYSEVDYEVYSRFFKKFWEKLQAQEVDFFQELAHFKSIRSQLKDSCALNRTLSVPASRWHQSFTVNRMDCHVMLAPELVSLDNLMMRARNMVSLGPEFRAIVRYSKKVVLPSRLKNHINS